MFACMYMSLGASEFFAYSHSDNEAHKISEKESGKEKEKLPFLVVVVVIIIVGGDSSICAMSVGDLYNYF